MRHLIGFSEAVQYLDQYHSLEIDIIQYACYSEHIWFTNETNYFLA